MTASSDESGVRAVVWVDGWQQECCGDAWALGSKVAWTVERSNTDYFQPLFDPPVTIDWHEEHHAESSAGLAKLEGIVLTIQGVQFDYAPRNGDARAVLHAVPGSARLTPLSRAAGEELRWDCFAGYLVTVET